MHRREGKDAGACLCPYCDAGVEGEAAFCVACRVAFMECARCGGQVREGVGKCPHCGGVPR